MNAVITGAGKGIGRAIAISLAKEGFNLIICSRTETDLVDVKNEIGRLDINTDVWWMVADLAKKAEVLAFASFVKKSCPTVHVLVNNAGIFFPGSILEETEGNLEQMMDINLFCAYHLTRQLSSSIIESKGHIFNMCSIASIMAYPNGGSYSISKYAMLGFSKVLRAELKEKMVKVTAVLPGATWSNSWKGAPFPEERLMKAEDVAESIISALRMGPSAVVEEIIIRPQLGDL